MPEPVDIYSDQFQLSLGPLGCTMNFSLSSPRPTAPGAPPQADLLASVRTSLEHLKLIAFILRRQVLQYERNSGVRVELPMDVLNALQIGKEDWDSFWNE
jgi:hypothetical protein